MLQIRLLGQFDIQRDGMPIAIPSRPAQSLLAFLLLNPTAAHRREKLAGLLWTNASEENSRNNLRRELWRLRKALENQAPRKRAVKYFLVEEMTIAFDAQSDYSLDTAVLQRTTDASSTDLIESLAAYRGELLPGFYDDWVLLERERLRAVFEQKMARLLNVLSTENKWSEILDWGERWIALGQTPEPAYRALMTAHSANGNVSQVAAVYDRCVQAMRADLGVEPSEQTHALYETLKSGKETPRVLSPTTFVTQQIRSSNIPVPLTSFVGREKELKEIAGLLSSSRLLTLMGSGGLGKTRLAIQTAHDSIRKFKGGVFWVSLVGLTDANLIPQEIAQSLGVREVSHAAMVETLLAFLKSKDTLLVLDNCEHLISASAQTSEQLLSACPNLKILATSRERLGIFSETVWRVPSLSENTGRQLYLERAQVAQRDFALTAASESFIAQICRRLDGIPLAIELAAARAALLSVEEIARRLDDRFVLLTAGSRTALPRQQTLRATIDWSHDLLIEAERVLFRRLGVFAGGFTLPAAETICGHGFLKRNDVLDLLGRLVDKSLVLVEQDGMTQSTRYRLLETIREYGQEKLNEIEGSELRDQHLEYFVNFVEEAEPQLELAEQGIWLDRVETELDNIRAAIDWALVSEQVVLALRIVGSLRRFWLIRNHDYEGFERMRTILNRPDAMEPTSARLKALNAYFFSLWPQGRLIQAQGLINEAMTLGEKLGDRWNTAYTLMWAGMSAAEAGNYSQAELYLQSSHDKWQEQGDATQTAMAEVFLAELALFQNEPSRGQPLLERAAQKFREVKDYPFLGMILRRLGQLAMFEKDMTKATALIQESLIHNWNVRDYRGTGACLAVLANISRIQGHVEQAVLLLGVVHSIIEFTHIPLLPFDQRGYELNLSEIKSQLDVEIFAQYWTKAKAITLEEAIVFAL